MTEQFPILIIIAPLFGAILIALLGFRHQSLCLPTVLGSLAISCAAAVGTFLKVLEQGTVLYNLSGWERVTTPRGLFSVSIEYRVDAISGLVLVAIAAVGLLNAIYSKAHVVTETPNKVPHYYILYLLLVAGLAERARSRPPPQAGVTNASRWGAKTPWTGRDVRTTVTMSH